MKAVPRPQKLMAAYLAAFLFAGALTYVEAGSRATRVKADIGGSRLLPCNLTPEPHFACRKSLL